MDSIMAHDDRYQEIFQLLKRGWIQTLNSHNKSIEEKLSFYKEKIRHLEMQWLSKNKELEFYIKEINEIRKEKEDIKNNFSRNGKNEFGIFPRQGKNGKSFSSRSVNSISPI